MRYSKCKRSQLSSTSDSHPKFEAFDNSVAALARCCGCCPNQRRFQRSHGWLQSVVVFGVVRVRTEDHGSGEGQPVCLSDVRIKSTHCIPQMRHISLFHSLLKLSQIVAKPPCLGIRAFRLGYALMYRVLFPCCLIYIVWHVEPSSVSHRGIWCSRTEREFRIRCRPETEKGRNKREDRKAHEEKDRKQLNPCGWFFGGLIACLTTACSCACTSALTAAKGMKGATVTKRRGEHCSSALLSALSILAQGVKLAPGYQLPLTRSTATKPSITHSTTSKEHVEEIFWRNVLLHPASASAWKPSGHVAEWAGSSSAAAASTTASGFWVEPWIHVVYGSFIWVGKYGESF